MVVCNSHCTPKASATWAVFITAVMPPLHETSVRTISASPSLAQSAVGPRIAGSRTRQELAYLLELSGQSTLSSVMKGLPTSTRTDPGPTQATASISEEAAGSCFELKGGIDGRVYFLSAAQCVALKRPENIGGLPIMKFTAKDPLNTIVLQMDCKKTPTLADGYIRLQKLLALLGTPHIISWGRYGDSDGPMGITAAWVLTDGRVIQYLEDDHGEACIQLITALPYWIDQSSFESPSKQADSP